MDISNILAELRLEREQLGEAILTREGVTAAATVEGAIAPASEVSGREPSGTSSTT